MANRYMKRWPTSLAVREMQIEATVRYHLTPGRMAVVHTTGNDTCGRARGENSPQSLLVGVQAGAATVGNWKLFRKERIQLPYDPAFWVPAP